MAGKALFKTSAHSGEATTLDWHPLRSNIIATGGGSVDRCVKIWDLEMYLSFLVQNTKDDSNMATNSNTLSSRGDSVLSDTSGNDNYTYVTDTHTVFVNVIILIVSENKMHLTLEYQILAHCF
jgi:WD40 repeat protein